MTKIKTKGNTMDKKIVVKIENRTTVLMLGMLMVINTHHLLVLPPEKKLMAGMALNEELVRLVESTGGKFL